MRRHLLPVAFCIALTACGPSLVMPEVDGSNVAVQHSRQSAMLATPEGGGPLPRDFVDPGDRLRTARVMDALMPAASPLCVQAGRRCFFRIKLVDDSVVNASAFGEDYIAINSGLLAVMESDEELAFVLAHELGHHIADHTEETRARMTWGGVLGFLAAASAAQLMGAGLATQLDAGDAGQSVGIFLGDRIYSKGEEREADYIAAYIMGRAGFDATAGTSVFDQFARIGGSAALKEGFLATHPSTPDRAARLIGASEEVAEKKALGLPLLPNAH